MIQSGAVLAVVVIFTGRLKQLGFQWRERAAQDYLLKLVVAFAITGVGGLLMKKAGFQLPDTARPVAWATLIGGVLFLVVERWLRGRQTQDQVSWLGHDRGGVWAIAGGGVSGRIAVRQHDTDGALPGREPTGGDGVFLFTGDPDADRGRRCCRFTAR